MVTDELTQVRPDVLKMDGGAKYMPLCRVHIKRSRQVHACVNLIHVSAGQ